MTKHTKTTMSDTLRTKSFMQSLMGYCTSFDLFCERVEWFASTLEAENAELLERLQERTQLHIHASQRDVQTIQQQAIEIDRLKGVNAEMLEVLEEIARLPVARMYPDGPCIERHDMNSVRAAIAKAKGVQP